MSTNETPNAIDLVYAFFDGRGQDPTPQQIKEYIIWSSQIKGTNQKRQRTWYVAAIALKSSAAAQVLATEAVELFWAADEQQDQTLKSLIANRAYHLTVLSKILYP